MSSNLSPLAPWPKQWIHGANGEKAVKQVKAEVSNFPSRSVVLDTTITLPLPSPFFLT